MNRRATSADSDRFVTVNQSTMNDRISHTGP